MKLIKNYTKNDKKLTVTVQHDEYAEHPRRSGYVENLGTLYAYHRRYSLADTDVANINLNAALALYESNSTIGFKVYMYEHCDIRLSTAPFFCSWDSGQVGFILVTKEKARQWFNVKRLSKKLVEKIETQLRSEIETYSKYLNGDVYEVLIEDEQGELIDHSTGFYDEPEKIANNVINGVY